MIVTVKGVVMALLDHEKEGKKSINCEVYQSGEKELVRVRLSLDQASLVAKGSLIEASGRLMAWKTRDGVGQMVLAQEVI